MYHPEANQKGHRPLEVVTAGVMKRSETLREQTGCGSLSGMMSPGQTGRLLPRPVGQQWDGALLPVPIGGHGRKVFVASTSPLDLSLRVSSQECLVARYSQTSLTVGCSWQASSPGFLRAMGSGLLRDTPIPTVLSMLTQGILHTLASLSSSLFPKPTLHPSRVSWDIFHATPAERAPIWLCM